MKNILAGMLLLAGISTLWASEKAYDFRLPVLNAKGEVAMKQYRKKVVVLNMWASWCGGCRKEMPLLDKVARKYAKKGVRIIAVNLDNKKSKAVHFIEKFEEKLGKKSAIRFAYDKKKETARSYKAKAFPLTVLIRKGHVYKRYNGSFNASNEATLLKDIDAALQ